MKTKVVTMDTMVNSVMLNCLSKRTIEDRKILDIFADSCARILRELEQDRLHVPLIKVDVCTDKITIGFYSVQELIDEEGYAALKQEKKDNWVSHEDRKKNIEEAIRGLTTSNRFNVRKLDYIDRCNYMYEIPYTCKMVDCGIYIYQDAYIISVVKEINDET